MNCNRNINRFLGTQMKGKVYFPLAYVVAYAILSIAFVATSANEVDERKLNSRIIGGSIANAKRYPYYTFLEITSIYGTSFCGGSLVNPDVILTAAHCIDADFFGFDGIIKIEAFVNYTKNKGILEELTGFEHYRSATSFIKHRDYDSNRIVNDIGLVFLDSPVYAVTPINLNENGDMPSVGDPLTVFGHGRISNAAISQFPQYLMEVSIPVVSFQDCNDQNSYAGYIVDQSMICVGASSGGKGTCNGDSGGPLIIRGNSATQDLQVGIVSFGSNKGCSIVNYPSVFTRVSNYKQWIQDLICQYSNVKPTYCSDVSQPTRKPTTVSVIAKPPTRKPKPAFRPTLAPTKKKQRTKSPTPEPTKAPFDLNAPVSFPSFLQAPIFNFPIFN